MKVFTCIALLLASLWCNVSSAERLFEVTTYENTVASWYELPQYFNSVPKYSGGMGTYTAKHLPVAVSCNLGRWATYSENHTGSLEIYLLNLDSGEKYLVHTVSGFVDPHQNAAIQCGGNKLWLTVSARSDTRMGYSYSSTDGIHWTLLGSHYRSYPQLHWVNGSLLTLYTNYERSADGSLGRELYSSCNGKRIVEGRHYMLSYYDGATVHVVYNDLIEDGTYGAADNRKHLSYTKSTDGGCTWTSPVLWYSGDEYVYLKDFAMLYGNELTALVVLSDSVDPNTGNRYLYRITANSRWNMTTTNHNYTTGALLTETGTVLWPWGITKYAGGLFGGMNMNYVRRVHGEPNTVIATQFTGGEYNSESRIIKIKINY